VLFVVGLFVFAVILCVGIPSYHLATSSRAVSGALRDARSVTLSEFVQYFDMSGSELARRERVLSTVSASDEQVRQLDKLCFDPHHRIQVVRPDGSDLRLDICFQCDNFRLGDGAIQTLPRPWLPRLAEFFAAAGIPVRAAEEYSKLHPN
jgi:hypothetical protein